MTTPRQKVAALRRAEKTLDALTAGHSSGCYCGICEAAVAVWQARVDITRPGWRDLIGVADRLPLDTTTPAARDIPFPPEHRNEPALREAAAPPKPARLAAGSSALS